MGNIQKRKGMRKLFTHCRAVQLLVVYLTCLMTITCVAQQIGISSEWINNSATISRALPRPQELARELVAGIKIERTLAPSDEHVYTARLENGAAIIAEADQEGIDLLIEIHGPRGLSRVRRGPQLRKLARLERLRE